MRLKLFTTFGMAICLIILAIITLQPSHAQSDARQVILLSSASRAATTSSDDQNNTSVNLNVRGAYLFLNVSGILTTPLITVALQAKDPIAGTYQAVFTATAGVSATKTYLIYPGIGSAADDVTEIRSYPLPGLWRVRVTHGNTDPITYSLSALLLP